MTWRLAGSLSRLLQQVNAKSPKRSKASDGTIGDGSHSARASDHNPNRNPRDLIPDGVVTALDITHDPANGCDAGLIAKALINDPRLGYIIWNRRIYNPSVSKTWRPYKGSNAHTKHVHISVHRNVDAKLDWALNGVLPPVPPIEIKPIDPALDRVKLLEGSRGAPVSQLQKLLTDLGYPTEVDGVFGKNTKKAVIAFQVDKGLTSDGKVGPYTWGKLYPDDSKPITTPAPITVISPPGVVVLEAWYEAGHFPPASDYCELWAQTMEGFEAEPYNDRGTLAQGHGHNAASGVAPVPVLGGAPWTREYAAEVCRADLALQVHYLKAYVHVPLLQRHVDAFALDIFQMGPGNWKKDKVLERLNAKDYDGAFQAMRDRNDVKGLHRRRGYQADIGVGKRPDPTKVW